MGADEEPAVTDVEIVDFARHNDEFRRVVTTGATMQIVVMTIPPGEEIGEETHPDTDQMLFFIEGEGESVIEGERSPLAAGHLVFVPAGTLHNFINTGDRPWRLVSAYAPPEHPPGTVHATRAEAEAAEHGH